MCNYVIWGAIKDHVVAQSYLWDSKRAKDFTFMLQVVGIIVTVLANLWNASIDKTIIAWIKRKCPSSWNRLEECIHETFDEDATLYSSTAMPAAPSLQQYPRHVD